MLRKLAGRFPVDAVPWPLRPVVGLYGYAAALALLAYFRLVRITSRLEVRGEELLEPGGTYVFTCWHDVFPIYLATGRRHAGQVWMVHPDWYMKPMHLLARWTGVERLVLGSTGHRGRSAREELERHLAAGHATTFLPDGPSEEPRVLRKGILHLALHSAVAIVPLTLRASRARRLRTWDRKRIPLPFSQIELTFGKPFRVTRESFADDAATLQRALSAAPSSGLVDP